jgi:hypothetical protein
MGILKRLFGRKSKKGDTDQALNAFLRANSYEEIKQVLSRYPELVTSPGPLRMLEAAVEGLQRGDYEGAPRDEAEALCKHLEVKRDLLRTLQDSLR